TRRSSDLVMLAVFGVMPQWPALISPLIIFCLFLFSLGISYILAVAYVFFGDIKHLYAVVLTLWMYCSAIFYPVDQLHGGIRLVIQNNPIYVYIHCLRKAVMYGAWPTGVELWQMLAWGAGMFLVGHMIFRRSRNRIMQRI